jgi:branched-chain amino acid transport system substrate-binding protein
MQTFTFVQNTRPKSQALSKRDATEIPFPSFLGNSYDATHMIALALQRAGSTDGEKLLGALEALGTYDGLIKTYSNPFSPDRHEVLGPDDYEMSVWKGPRLELIG